MDPREYGLRAWEPEEGEVTSRNQGKPWRAFKIFRDLGPGRTLKAAAIAFYERTPDTLPEHHYNTVKKWATKYDWHNRVQAFDDHYEMHKRATIEDYLDRKEAGFQERQGEIRDRMLGVAEKAIGQAEKMLEWPLTEQRVLRETEDGTQQTLIFLPARWSKATIRSMYDMAAGAVNGNWTTLKQAQDPADNFDFSDFTDDELLEYIKLSDKLGVRRGDLES